MSKLWKDVRRILIRKECYELLKASSALIFKDDSIIWNRDMYADWDGQFYVLNSPGDKIMNQDWQKRGVIYESTRQIRSLLESCDWAVVADKKTAYEIKARLASPQGSRQDFLNL